MRLPSFDVQAHTSMNETLALLKEHDPAAVVLAEGADLVPRMRRRLIEANLVLSHSYDVIMFKGSTSATPASF